MKQYIALLVLMFVHEAHAGKKSKTKTHKTSKQQVSPVMSGVSQVDIDTIKDDELQAHCQAIEEILARTSIKIQEKIAAIHGLAANRISQIQLDNELLLNEKARHKAITFHQWSHKPSFQDKI